MIRELAAERAHRAACCSFGRGVDQIRDALGLHEIHLVVQESSTTKLPRLRQPSPQLDATPKQHLQDDRPAVPLQLKNILAGVGRRSREKENQPIVDRPAVGRAENHPGSASRFWQGTLQLQRQGRQVPA